MPRSESVNIVRTYMWRSLRAEGCERGELRRTNESWTLCGTIFRFGDSGPAEARYEIVCDTAWRTKITHVFCKDDLGERDLRLARQDDGWYANERLLALPRDCIDVDLWWSPSTNTLPIRRLNLSDKGDSGPLTAAWIRMPELTVDALHQRYERTGRETYIYSSRGGLFRANLAVDEDDLVVHYEGVWECVGRT